MPLQTAGRGSEGGESPPKRFLWNSETQRTLVGGAEGQGKGRAGRKDQESLLGSRGTVVHFPSCFTQHESLCNHGNRPAVQEGIFVLALEFLVSTGHSRPPGILSHSP